jgi:cytochrome c oxidase cbb3-type subunit 3
MPTKIERDEVSGVDTTGHVWDGIKELNTPLPRWWVWIFYATIIWSVGYWIAYPAWPTLTGYTKGLLGYSSRAELETNMTAARAAQAANLDRIEAMSLVEIKADANLLQFAVAGGKSAFAVNCSQCHGSGASGSVAYPNLNDDDWLWGGTLDALQTSISHGIRDMRDDDTRISDMPAFLSDELLDKTQVAQVAEFVLSLSGSEHDAAAAKEGAMLYEENCAACHGETGQGDQEQGAPNLSNQIWLYGGDRATIVETISYSRKGMMPAWNGILDEATIKQLTLYVHSLGGGE